MKRVFVSLSILFIVQTAFGDIVCDVDVPKYYASYKPISYQCNPGEFLPANTLGCRSCPTGYTCPGGTYKFNPNEYQGLENIIKFQTNTINNVCGDNLPVKFVAKYKPNTINLNWYDGDTLLTVQPAAQTCIYGERITLPDIVLPQRPGYIFAGWQLRTTSHQQQSE